MIGLLTEFPTKAQSVSFSNLTTQTPGFMFAATAWADFDNDGLLDVVIAGFTNQVSYPQLPPPVACQLWRSLGNGTFTNVQTSLPGVGYGSLAWGDYDNDGYADLLITGQST